MSTPTTTNSATPSKSKAKKYKDKDKARDRDRKEKTLLPSERLKIVVRRLPPNLPEEIFWQSVSNWVTDESALWKAYYLGKPKKRANKENIPSRAYIAFKTLEQLLAFSREYDGHKFVDKAGTESYAIVEYAPYQKVPGEKKKPDSRHATIEKDEDYISFIESLKAPANAEPVTIEALVASMRPSSPPKTTPLLEALKAEKQAQKDKEAIIRNHAHYKDLTNGPPPSVLRKEEKRKAAARPSRKHAVKNIKGAAPAPAPAPAPKPPKDTPTPSVTAATAPAPAQPQVNDGAPSVVASARRGRPILGLGSRQFEAALSGVGAAGGRKRAEKSKEETPGAPDLPQENTSQEKPNPPTSPRKPRHRKGGPASTAAANPDVNSAGVLVMPGVVQIDSGGSPPTQTYGVRGGKRGGRGGRGGRGRGGPPRTG